MCVIMVADEIKPVIFLFIQHTVWVGEVHIDCAKNGKNLVLSLLEYSGVL